MKNQAALLGILMLACTYTYTQDTLFFENFDDSPGSKPGGWSTEYIGDPNKPWEFVDGGGTTTPSIPGSRRPTGAYSGDVNALYFFESLQNQAGFLITPAVDLEFAVRAELRFRHAQMNWLSFFADDNDELQVYYKTHSDSSWNELNIIGEYLDAVESWTQQVILVPDEALGPTTYFGFKATTKYGYGVCIDDVGLLETGSAERFVDTVIVSHENLDLIPGGSENNPVLKVGIKVLGNSGTLVLNSLTAKSLNTSDADVAVNGVKLYSNSSSKDFYAADPLDTISLSSGMAGFTGLSLELPSGYTYLWVTFDITETASHGNVADAMLEALSIDISGSSYPASDWSPAGEKIIQEAVFYDDFTADKGWTLGGDFERGRPLGLGGNFLGNPDPEHAAGDTMVIGTDLSGLGAIPGDYEPNVSKYVNLATSPSLDLYYYNDLKLNFLRWLNSENSDTASIEISNDGGTEWDEIWNNKNNTIIESKWSLFSLAIPDASRQSDVRFRINLGPTTTNNHFSGWNIDNFSITGNYLEQDIGITALLAPLSGCDHTSADTVTVRIENFGPGATPASIPLRYSLNGGTSYTYDTITEAIPFNNDISYTFTPTADLSIPGIYNLLVETLLDSDEEPDNNSFDTVLYVDPTYSLPYFQDFESGVDFWRTSGTNSSWQYGTPSGSVITKASSGTVAWVTNLSGTHNDNEESFLTGPCFDFSGLDYPVFECRIFTNTQEDVNGAAIEYSLDNGSSWSRLGSKGDGDEFYWNWYNSDVVSELPDNHGWTGSSAQWMTARIQLDTNTFRGLPSAKFRFRFGSSASNGLEGFGVDDISIYDTPRDLGVLSIGSPGNGCLQDLDKHVKVTIKNFGLDTLPAGDTIIAGYRLETEPTVIDTFVLADMLLRGDTVQYVFSEEFILASSGTKNISAFTLLPDDTDFYNDTTTNDTTSKSFLVEFTPVTNLPEFLYTLHPDTVVLDAYTGNPTDTYLWQDGSTDSVFHVTENIDTVYHVVVDNGICNFRDTTRIHYLIVDAELSAVLHPVSACEPDDSVFARVSITNHGSYKWEPGQEITLGLIVHEEDTIEEIMTVSADIEIDSSAEYTFLTPIDLSQIRSYDLSAYNKVEGDDSTFNDTSHASIDIFGITAIDLGADTTVRALTYILDAGAGNDSYLWQDGSTLRTLTIDTTGWYSVTVQQGTRCASTDSVHMTLLVPDITIGRITNLDNSCQLSATENLDILLRNTGSDALISGDTIAFTYQVNAGTLTPDTLFLSQDMLPGDSLLFSFTNNVDLSATGSYQFTITADFRKDLVPGNDTLRKTIEIFGFPDISLGADTISHIDSLILDAGPGDYTYFWHDSTTDRHYTVYYGDQTTDKFYSVSVSDVNGCTTTDKVRVSFEYVDIGISSILLPLTGCELGDMDVLSVRIMNYGNFAVSNESSQVIAIINNGSPVSEQLNFTDAFNPGDSLDFTFSAGFDLSQTGEHRIDLYTIYDFDIDLTNDSLAVIIEHYPDPIVDLGGVNDTIKTLLPYTLDAGEGFTAYFWNEVEGTQTFEVDAPGWYVARVSDTNTCTGTDSVHITALVPDIAVDRISNLQNSCQLGPAEDLEILIINTGTNALVAGDTIALTSIVNGGEAMVDTLFMTQGMPPGDSLVYTFTDKVDLSEAGNYQFSITADFSRDQIPSNDTLLQTIEIYLYPDIFLGTDTIIHTDSLMLDAGEGTYSYLWHDSTTERYYTVHKTAQTPDQLYRVSVTNGQGCVSTDDIKVSFGTADIGIGGIILPLPGCMLSNEEELTVRIMNFGEAAIRNESSQVIAIFNSDSTVTGLLNFSQAFKPGDSLEYTFSGTFDLSVKGQHRFDLYTIYSSDSDDSNNSLAVFIDHFELPAVNLGGENDTIKTLLPYTLDAGEGFTTYTWNGTDGTQTYQADASGWYSVVVSDTNTCMGTDSVYILSTVSIRDIKGFEGNLRIFPNPASDVLEIEILLVDHCTYLLELISTGGQTVISKQCRKVSQFTESLDVSDIPAGVYYLRVRNHERQELRKVVIQ